MREREILLTRRMFSNEVDRILNHLEGLKDDPVRYAQVSLKAQREFNRLDSWFTNVILSSAGR